jgi:integrase
MSLKLVQEDSGVWYIRGTLQGQRVRESAQTTDRDEAEQIKVQIESNIFTRTVYGTKAVATFEEAVDLYLDAGGDGEHLTPILDEWRGKKLSAVNQALMDKLAKKLKPTAANSTLVRKIYTPILAVMNHAATQGLCDPIKVKKPKVEVTPVEWLTPSQAADWIEALEPHPHLKRAFIFMLSTGCRVSEMLNSTWKDYMPGEDRCVFWKTKKGYPRGADIPAKAREVLPARNKDPEADVFLNSFGESWHCYDALNLRWRKIEAQRLAAIEAGADLPKLAPLHNHMTRHTWATWAYACTRDLAYLMYQGGWKSASMVMKYTHLASEGLAREVLMQGWTFSGREVVKLPEPVIAPAAETAVDAEAA